MQMLGQIPTTPFGRRSLSLNVVRTQRLVKDCPQGRSVHKWQVFRQISEAKIPIGLSDRALSVLNALLTFHPDTVLVSGSGDLVVFPSNRRLSQRAHGIALSTLRRHLAILVECGLILRRDSPNGKRYARKGQGGEIEQAFGFDLGPIVSRADEFAKLAEGLRADRRALDIARQRITLCRRDIAKMIATGIEEGVSADWPALHGAFTQTLGRIPRCVDRTVLEPIAEELAVLAAEITRLLEQHVKPAESSATESHSERHIQNSNSETPIESEPGFRKATSEPDRRPVKAAETIFPLRMILEACPDLIDYARGGISHWREFMATVAVVRPMLGVSASAWTEACEVFGEPQACIVLAAILQRASAIKSPGGYLRTLTRRAVAGSFSVGPMLMALISARRPMLGKGPPSDGAAFRK
jgi:replication initiation protein RepC